LIEASGPDPFYVEPGGSHVPPAEAFSTCFTDGRLCLQGTAEGYARGKAARFPTEGGPAILELEVPQWILNILLNDPIMAAFARSGEARFEPGFGFEEILAEWPVLTKRVIQI
jgi:hypothetical protein